MRQDPQSRPSQPSRLRFGSGTSRRVRQRLFGVHGGTGYRLHAELGETAPFRRKR